MICLTISKTSKTSGLDFGDMRSDPMGEEIVFCGVCGVAAHLETAARTSLLHELEDAYETQISRNVGSLQALEGVNGAVRALGSGFLRSGVRRTVSGLCRQLRCPLGKPSERGTGGSGLDLPNA
jgi:hypothetical protein